MQFLLHAQVPLRCPDTPVSLWQVNLINPYLLFFCYSNINLTSFGLRLSAHFWRLIRCSAVCQALVVLTLLCELALPPFFVACLHPLIAQYP